MKLLYCKSCHDSLKLITRVRSCTCGQSSGKILEDFHSAEVWGRYSEVIGVDNLSLHHALKSPDLDPPEDAFGYGPQVKAFLCPHGYEKVTRHVSAVSV